MFPWMTNGDVITKLKLRTVGLPDKDANFVYSIHNQQL